MPFVLLLVIAFVLRVPLWMSPEGLNSDHAVSALQAMHFLRGEYSWFLWGVGYQASFEPAINALLFLLLGENSYAVLATSFLAYGIALWAIYAVLRRRLPLEKAILAALFVVIVTPPLFLGTFYPPRPWCLTTIFLGLYCADRGWFGRAAFLAFFSLYVDFFAIQFLPALLAFTAARVWYFSDRKTAFRKFAGGVFLGTFVLGVSRTMGPVGSTHLGIKFNYFVSNLKLMASAMLPMIYGFPTQMASQEIPLPLWFRNPLWFLARVSAGLIPFIVFLRSLRHWREWDRDTQVLCGFGILLCATSLTGTVLSADVYDVYAYRYLTPLTWALPFLLLPSLQKADWKKSLAVFSPYFLVVCLTSQLYFGPATPFGQGTHEKQLGEFLARENIHHGYSSYWPAYRITYLSRERLVVVPFAKQANRYESYWQAVEAAPRYALVFTKKEEALYREQEALLEKEKKTYKPFGLAGYQGFLVTR